MMKCSKRFKRLFGILKVRDIHSYLVTNAFSTLESENHFEVIKTCQDCGFKEVRVMLKETLVEAAQKYPHAFSELLREYIASWTV